MAKITAISSHEEANTSSSPRKPAKRAPPPSPPPPVSLFIWLIPTLTVAFSIYCNYRGMQATPHGWFHDLMSTSPTALRSQAGLPRSFHQSLDDLPRPFDRILLVLDLFFVQAAATSLGKGLVAIMASIALPWFVAELIEGLKVGQRRAPLGIEGFALIVIIAGVYMFGCVIPLVSVPAMAIYGWRQATKKPSVIRPLPSPDASVVQAVVLNVAISGLPILGLLLIDAQSYPVLAFYNNIGAVLFPLAWFPLLILRSRSGSTKHRKHVDPRLAASNAYRLLAYLTIPAWWGGGYVAIPQLLRIIRGSTAQWPDDATSLLFWDICGLLAGAYALVLVQAEVDFRAVQCGGPRVHRARLLVEDIVFGSTGLLLLGPGFAFSMYLARREVLAEKARFGVAPAFVEEAEKLDGEIKAEAQKAQ